MMQKFFLKRVRKFIIYMFIPLIIVFIMSIFILFKNTHQDIIQQGKQTVDAVSTNFEVVISNILYQNDLLSNTTRMSIALRKMLSQSEMSYSDAIHISSLRSILNSISSTHDYVDSIYLYLDSYESYFSSDGGVRNLTNSNDTTWLTNYLSMDQDMNFLMTTRNSNNLVDSLETLSIFQRILLQQGCIVVNINIDKFRTMLRSMTAEEYESVFIVNHKGEILLAENNNKPLEDMEEALLQQIILEDGKYIQDKWIKYNNSYYLFSINKYNEQDVYIISAISIKATFKLLLNMLRIYLLIFICNCLIIIGISYITTKRTFEQIQYMIDIFDNAEKGIFTDKPPIEVKDEYSIVMNNVIHLFVNTTYLNTQLKEKEYHQEVIEQKALQLQINPHFLFNTLQSLDLEVQKTLGLNSDVSKMIRNVSDILKYSLSNPQETVTVKQEIEYLKKYIDIQKFRFGDEFIVYYEIEEDAMSASVFKLMLQPIVENSILHGIRNINRQGYIKIKIFKRNDFLNCIVMDNGNGMNREMIQSLYHHIANELSESIGLTNVNRRLILKYGSKSAIKLQGKMDVGSIVSFKIPL